MLKNQFVAYYRVSTERQGKSGLGLQAQQQAVRDFIKSGTIIAEFKEVESGKKADRPQLAKALAAARLHKVPLIVAKLDRVSRNVAFLSRLLESGVEIRFCDLPDVQGPTGQFLLHSMAAVSADIDRPKTAVRWDGMTYVEMTLTT